jgi:hypothetical protein
VLNINLTPVITGGKKPHSEVRTEQLFDVRVYGIVMFYYSSNQAFYYYALQLQHILFFDQIYKLLRMEICLVRNDESHFEFLATYLEAQQLFYMLFQARLENPSPSL